MNNILLLLLICFQSVYYDGRYGGAPGWYSKPSCNSPRCEMDNYIRQLLAQQKQQQVIQTTPDPVAANNTKLVPKTVQRQIKHCNGRTCWYETVNETVWVQEPISSAQLTITELHPTPDSDVYTAVRLLEATPDEVIADLGCGDGRILKAACEAWGCRGVGVELNSETANAAKQACANLPIVIYNGNVLNYTYKDVDIVYVYLYQDLLDEVIKRLEPGTRIVSYMHSPHPNAMQLGDFYVWRVPENGNNSR